MGMFDADDHEGTISEPWAPDCQCPKCGRIHRDLRAGTPPASISRWPWQAMDNAPRDRVIDLWAKKHGMTIMSYRRFTDCWWRSDPQRELGKPNGLIVVAFGTSGWYQGDQLLDARYWMLPPGEPVR